MDIFTTERLLVRTFAINDAHLLYLLQSNPVVMQYISGGKQTMEETSLKLRQDIEHQKKHGFSKWALFLKSTGGFIGRAGWTLMETTGEAEVGFRLLPEYWRQGYATEILQALLVWGKTNIPFPLIAFAYPENVVSIHLLKKVGMVFIRCDKHNGREVLVYSVGE